jgi:hypothetical protein
MPIREWLCEENEIANFSARVTRDMWERNRAGDCDSRVTRGHVTTYRPEHVVNRADRTPVAVAPRLD